MQILQMGFTQSICSFLIFNTVLLRDHSSVFDCQLEKRRHTENIVNRELQVRASELAVCN